MHTPYTYLIGWSEHNKWYYGVRFAEGCFPEELWKTYFTSSKHVKKMMEMYGSPNIIQIRKIFKDGESAQLWEHKVLRRLRAASSPHWINKTDNKSIDLDAALKGARKKKSEETKRRMSEYRKGMKYSKETCEKIKQIALNRPKDHYTNRPPVTIETRQKLSEIAKLNVGVKNPFYGRKHTEETKQKIRDAKKSKSINKQQQ